MLRLPSAWVWDFWLADDGDRFHLFFLKASRALGDPDRRHWRASIGHATSDDLVSWAEQADALVPSDGPAFDDLATWTGSVVRGDDDRWRMFYTGVDRASGGLVQRVSSVTSDDLLTWSRAAEPVIVAPDRAWYESLDDGHWPDEAWRDPWVYRDPRGGWRMLITARTNRGAGDARGVVGTARSADLEHWSVEPPLSQPGGADDGFGQLEVLQLAEVHGRWVLVFSCLSTELSAARRARGERGGVWAVNVDDPIGPFDIASAYRLTDETLYVGRLVQDRSGTWVMLAFRNTTPEGEWIGEITDPIPVEWVDGRLWLLGAESGLRPPLSRRSEEMSSADAMRSVTGST